jgi:fructosamine-3-kinase
MAKAEFEGQKAIAAVIPDHAIEPIAWGYCEKDRSQTWFLTHFRRLDAELPDKTKLVSVIKKLHEGSVSPTGKFGFHTVPFFGPPPMVVDWSDNWEEFWTREFRSSLAYVLRMRGKNPELQQLAEDFIEKVVPRLLRPLQTGGRNITPRLCHGDLWHGNIQIDQAMGETVLFDPCPFYGHQEMDLQCMRGERSALGLGFVKRYGEEVGRSDPIDDFDDRNALYAV